MMWFSTISICGYVLEKEIIDSYARPPFRIYALISEVPEYIDTSKIKSLVKFYIGFDIKYRSLENIMLLKAELEDYVKSFKTPVSGTQDFYSGIDADMVMISYENDYVELELC